MGAGYRTCGGCRNGRVWMIYVDPLRDVQIIPPTGHCLCGNELYGAETICPDCKEEEARNEQNWND